MAGMADNYNLPFFPSLYLVQGVHACLCMCMFVCVCVCVCIAIAT